jgi:hypothetical protein
MTIGPVKVVTYMLLKMLEADSSGWPSNFFVLILVDSPVYSLLRKRITPELFKGKIRNHFQACLFGSGEAV